jgi:D-Tyr-tRNAtyr deacylase
MSAAPCWLFRNSRSTATRAVNAARAFLKVPVATGVFQARMSVEIVNDGPVTILLDSDKLF